MRIVPKSHCLKGLNSLYSTVRYSSQLFVSRLSYYTNYNGFRELFSPYGKIKEAKLIMDSRTGRTKGFGFVTFETEAEAQDAIKGLNGKFFLENTPVVRACIFGVSIRDLREIASFGKIVLGRLIFVETATTRKADGNDAPPKS